MGDGSAAEPQRSLADVLAANEQQKQDEAAERDRVIGIGTMRPLEEEEVRRVAGLVWLGRSDRPGGRGWLAPWAPKSDVCRNACRNPKQSARESTVLSSLAKTSENGGSERLYGLVAARGLVGRTGRALSGASLAFC